MHHDNPLVWPGNAWLGTTSGFRPGAPNGLPYSARVMGWQRGTTVGASERAVVGMSMAPRVPGVRESNEGFACHGRLWAPQRRHMRLLLVCALPIGAAGYAALRRAPPPPLARAYNLMAGLRDDELPTASIPMDTLVRYGPVVFCSRLLNRDQFEARVATLLERHPGTERLLAEQVVCDSLSEGGDYWRGEERPESLRAAAERIKKAKLMPPVDTQERNLVVAWVAILVLAAAQMAWKLSALPADPQASATEILLSVPAESLQF